jgi:hypothetical protein
MAVQYTYRQLYSEALDFVGLRLEDISSDADMMAKAKAWPNRALDDLSRYYLWPWLRLTVDVPLAAGASTVNLPADFEAIADDDVPILVGIASSWLRPVSRTDLRKRSTLGQSGQPSDYRVTYNGPQPVMVLDVAAGVAYTVRLTYIRSIAPMQFDADRPAVPAAMHDLVRLGTLAIAEEEQDRVPQGRMRPAYEQGKQLARLRSVAGNPNDIRPLQPWGPANGDLSIHAGEGKVTIEES